MRKAGIQNPWIWGIGLSVLVLIGLFDPAQYGIFPSCPFRWLTGWKCPGCGSQRALHHLLHFEWGQAFWHNPLLVVSLPYILAGFAFDSFDIRNERLLQIRRTLFGYRAILIVAGIVILFWIGMNLVSFQLA